MGVPAFFRWLSRKYPSIVVCANEERARQLEDGSEVPIDSSLPNPNEVEFDNLYLDMNGIIHPCCHPEDRPAPRNEEEMMVLIFEYIDRIFRIVRPRRLLYMAIDGVAPRAKMNQQRSRRFRASKEVVEKEEEIGRIKQRLMDEGLEIPQKDPQVKGEKFDSNCITPGTEFMANLADNLRYYVHHRLNNDPGWSKISVILSDANVPGEGEHKIMDFIRKQRANPNHDPNTHHCLCGADADLIMLGLATHEPNFTIIREEFKPGQPRPCELCGQFGHELKMCTGKAKKKDDEEIPPPPPAATTDFIFLRLPVLREYLQNELAPQRPLPYKYDFERAIDDWVFMCFFVGNDFLPHLPSLEIREGAIDRLIELYKSNSDRNGGYLTENGFVHFDRVQVVLTELGKMEDGILKNRASKDKFFRKRDRERENAKRCRKDEEDDRQGKRRRSEAPGFALEGAFAPVAISRAGSVPLLNARQSVHDARIEGLAYANNLSSAQKLRAMLLGGPEQVKAAESGLHRSASTTAVDSMKRKNEDPDADPNDIVRLGEEGWKQRYYMNKFGVAIDDDWEFQQELVRSYVEGLSWVLQYYYQGCPSWNWYYPYHYSPFASDFIKIDSLKMEFPLDTKPFKPLEQLMGVFPEASGNFLPPAWRKLMADTESPIVDFYPTDFCVDLNGKKFAWQGVALLPFVDEDRLLKALDTVYDTLTAAELGRNSRGEDLLFVGHGHTIFRSLSIHYYSQETTLQEWVSMDDGLINGMGGLIGIDQESFRPSKPVSAPYPSLPDLMVNQALSVLYRDPFYPSNHRYLAVRLQRGKSPPKVLGIGKAQLGFSTDRRPVNLEFAAHRMLSAGGGGGGGGGRGGFYQRDSQAQHDGRRSLNEERDSGSRYDQRQRDANRGGDRGRGRGRGREDVGNGYNYHNVAPNYSSSSTTGRMSGYGTYLDSAFGRVSGSGGGGGGSHRQTTEQQFSDRSRERDRERDGFRESDRSGGSGTHWQHGRAGAGNGLGGRGGYQQTDFGGFPVYPAQSDSNSRQQGYDAYGYNDHSTYNSSYSSHSANGSGSAGYQNDNHRQQGRDRDRLTMPPPVYQSPPAGPPRYYTDNYRRSN